MGMNTPRPRQISLSALQEKLVPLLHEARDQEVLRHMLTYAAGSESEAAVSLLVSRIAQLEKDHKINQTIDYEDYTIELNRIRAGIRTCLDQLPPHGKWVEPETDPTKQEQELIPPPAPSNNSVWKTLAATAGFAVLLVVGYQFFGNKPEPIPEKHTPAVLPSFVLIKGGHFMMGSKDGPVDEQPLHQENVQDFFLAKTEVTVDQYRDFCDETGRKMPVAPAWGWRDHDPIVNVSWHDATAYCEWMAKKTGKPVRLPTEVEWEYATLGSAVNRLKLSHNFPRYAGGDNPNPLAWFSQNSNGEAHTAGTKSATPEGIFDLSGNVFEWTSSYYLRYTSQPGIRVAFPGVDNERVGRGGGWNSNPDKLTRTSRNHSAPDYADDQLGFRVAQSVAEK